MARVVYVQATNYKNKIYADSLAIAQGRLTIPPGYILAAESGDVYRGDPTQGFLPAQFYAPVYSGGFPAYDGGTAHGGTDRQLGFVPGAPLIP
jgi:hypothetical protein